MATTLSQALETHFPQPRWSKPHAVALRARPNGSSTAERDLEGSRSTHRIGSKHGHFKDGRKAGHLFDGLDDDHGVAAREVEHQEAYEARLDKLVRDSRDEDGRDHVWDVRQVKAHLPDHKAEDPTHHGNARYTLKTTEDSIKSQRLVLDLKKKQAAEKAKQERQQSDGHLSEDKSNKGAGPTPDGDKKEGDKKDDKKKKDDGKDSKSNDRELSDEERTFLKHITAEIHQIESLKNNSGKLQTKVADHQVEPTIDEQDQFLPDSWIARSEKLIRLTGQQPLNAEPDLTELFEAGLITPNKLHYVRNHGEVPKLDWSHTLEIFSDPPDLLRKPRSFTMDELAAFPHWARLPVTLACDGNRRKEVNMVKRSTGFNWGAGGASCVYWKGPLLRDLLLACEPVDQPPDQRWYVHYEGADDPSEGKYGTSIPFAYAMDPNNDVMLAQEMNDLPLHPDHGYPLRSIIPGFVGGRCVKWLKKVWISDKPSTNHYHIYDNRVLPSHITDNDSLEAKAFFHHPDTICNEQALQSVICRPAHDEHIRLDADAAQWTSTYRVAGYAYSGGGVQIQRVELSLDGGQTWRYAFREHVDDWLRHGTKQWAWLHWYVDVPYAELVKPGVELVCRAWDIYKNTQPESITWNLSGMMNNSRYRVKPRFELQGDQHDHPSIVLDHPVAPGAREGGWMKLGADEAAKLAAEEAKSDDGKELTTEEIAKHATKDDCWIVINGKVYDVTSTLSWHPGGANAILAHAGKVHTETSLQYNSVHDGYANSKRDECLIGKLTQKGLAAMKEDAKRAEADLAREAEERKDFAIQKHRWTAIKLKNREELSPDTRLYKFALPGGEDAKLGLPIGQHVAIGCHFSDSMVVRQYTPVHPILPDEENGELHLLVKTYFGTDSFPPGGTLGNFLDVLEVGEEVDARGPLGEIAYEGNGDFTIEGKKHHFDRLSLVSGGSGITPIYQLVHAICKRPDDRTQIRLVNCDKDLSDVLLLMELRELEAQSNGRFKMWIILSHPDPKDGDWDQGKGHLDDEAIKGHLFEADEQTAAFVCGPPALISKAAEPGLKKVGYKDEATLFGF